MHARRSNRLMLHSTCSERLATNSEACRPSWSPQPPRDVPTGDPLLPRSRGGSLPLKHGRPPCANCAPLVVVEPCAPADDVSEPPVGN